MSGGFFNGNRKRYKNRAILVHSKANFVSSLRLPLAPPFFGGGIVKSLPERVVRLCVRPCAFSLSFACHFSMKPLFRDLSVKFKPILCCPDASFWPGKK